MTFNLKTLLTYITTSFVYCKPQISGKFLLLLNLYLHWCFLPLCYLITSLHIVFRKCLFLTRFILTYFSPVKVSDIGKENSMRNGFANSGKYHCTGLHFDIILRAIEARTLAWKNLLGQLQSAEMCQNVKKIPPPSICKTVTHTPKHPQPFEATPTPEEKSMLVICHILIYMP